MGWLGLSLDLLIDIYFYQLEPYVETEYFDSETKRTYTVLSPISIRYDRLMSILSQDKEIVVKYKEELFGTQLPIVIDSGELMFFNLCKQEFMPPYHEFLDLDKHDKARYIASSLINQMISTLERHEELQKRNKEEMRNKRKRGH